MFTIKKIVMIQILMMLAVTFSFMGRVAMAGEHLHKFQCNSGQVLKYLNKQWVCALDNDTLGTDTLAELQCNEGDIAKNINNTWVCAEDKSTTTADNSLFVGADNDNNDANSTIEFGTDSQSLMTLKESGDLVVKENLQYRSGILNATGAVEALRIIRGNVQVQCYELVGAGYQCTHLANGQYRIDFNEPFTGVPTGVASVPEAGLTYFPIMAGIYCLETHCIIKIRRSDNGVLGDYPFSFIVTGPY